MPYKIPIVNYPLGQPASINVQNQNSPIIPPKDSTKSKSATESQIGNNLTSTTTIYPPFSSQNLAENYLNQILMNAISEEPERGEVKKIIEFMIFFKGKSTKHQYYFK